jgi:branched-chain amino acid transport system permease protein
MFKRNHTPDGILIPTSARKYRTGLIVMTLIIGALPLVAKNPYIHTLGSLVMIFSVYAISIDILTGYFGLLAIGQSAFFGFGAYTCGYLLTKMNWDFVPAILMGLLMSGLLALIFGLITIKTWDNTFFMITIALVQLIWGIAYKATTITGGENGMGGIKRPHFFGINFSNSVNFYYLLFIVMVLVIIISYRFVNSPFGLTVHGIRESRKRMRALGYNIYMHKLITYIFAGLLSGLAGIMYCLFNRFVSHSDINTMASSMAFLMTLLGGAGSLVGAMIGSTIIIVLRNVISSLTDRWTMVMGVLYILVVMLSPGGVVGTYQNVIRRVRKRRERGLKTLVN